MSTPPSDRASRVSDSPDAAQPFLHALRPEALHVPHSGIEEIFNYGYGRQGLIPLWVGESDMPTPAFLCEAAARSFAAGETFYTLQGGIPQVREAIADYMTRHYGGPFAGAATEFSPERFYVTVGGMHALQIAMALIAGAGDEVLLPTPAWPNFAGVVGVAGARAVECPMEFSGHDDRGIWHLDIDRLAAAVGPRTRALVVNSPSNPTGWVASTEDLQRLLDFARHNRLWIVADEIYGRLVYDGARAPSFHDIMAPDDLVLFVQTLSKNWSMTGWRVGWLEAPPALGTTIESMVQYSTSGVAVPLQRAAALALREGEGLVADLVTRIRHNRDRLCDALHATGGFRFARPAGAFYVFCGLERQADSRSLARRLVDEAGIGVAPGIAFGAAGEGFVRICHARRPEDMDEVARRLTRWSAA